MNATTYGGSAQGIREHYDMPDRFWEVVLGPSMTYSSALFDAGDQLDAAQERKVRWHLDRAAARGRVLEVGCGWGTLLERAAARPGVTRAVGLTLSETQFAYVRARKGASVDVRLENWARYKPDAPFDSIVSIGAFEHFAKPTETLEEKRAVYRDFFGRCRSWLNPSGRLTLQTIAFGTMRREEASGFMNDIIFPESDLPTLSDIVESSSNLFELVEMRNDRLHYAETLDAWARNLRRARGTAVDVVGEDRVRNFERYLKMSSIGFRMGKISLLRFAMRPIVSEWRVANEGFPH